MWYNKWFNSPYYHLLYKHRDEDEAKLFIDNLEDYLQLKPGDKILDMPCGRGRHAVYLNKKGYDVTGIDLSEENIKYATSPPKSPQRGDFPPQLPKGKGDGKVPPLGGFRGAGGGAGGAGFYVHDMRNVYKSHYYDYILNLFTSFGYFEEDTDNVKVIKSAAQALVSGGKLIIDFMNTNRVINSLVTSETIKVENISFNLKRNFEDGFIVKKINFQADGRKYQFEEKVKAITKDEFLSYFKQVGLMLEDVFGDYRLNDFDEKGSDRMIFVLRK
ncbi:MAG: methyltransferase domain-containing protein [Cytophagales bacterium]|nr:methyltransferase domain-containing protein [Cytophagales bacterium]